MSQGAISEIGRFRAEQGYYRFVGDIGITEIGRYCKELIRNSENALATSVCSATVAFANSHSTYFVYDGKVVLSLDKCFQMPKYTLKVVEAMERTTSDVPVYFSMISHMTPFDAVFPDLSDTQLSNLRTFLYTTLNLFDTFTIYITALDDLFTVKAHRKMNVKQLYPNHNQVTLSMIIVP
jgi:hypothetical protein